MAISLVTVQGDGVSYLNNEVDYLTTSDENNDVRTNRPLKNLAARDAALRDGVNAAIAELNNAAGSAASLTARLAVEHNADGTHIGGSPHGPVSIPVGHTYLSVLNAGGFQNLTATVGSVAGTLCDAGDTRLRRGFVLVSAVGGDYATPKAALDAGHTHILVAPGSYVDVGAIIINDPVVIIGIGKPSWSTDNGLALQNSAYGSRIENLEISSSTQATIRVTGIDYFVGRNLHLVPLSPGEEAFYAYDSNYGVLANLDVSGAFSAGGFPLNALMFGGSGAYRDWHIQNVTCELAGHFDFQSAITFSGTAKNIVVRDIYASYVNYAVSFSGTSFDNVTVENIHIKDSHDGVLSVGAGAAVGFLSTSDAESVVIRGVYADFNNAKTVDYGVIFGAANIRDLSIEDVKVYTHDFYRAVSVITPGDGEIDDSLVRGVVCRGAPGVSSVGIQAVYIQSVYNRLTVRDIYLEVLPGGTLAKNAALWLRSQTTLTVDKYFECLVVSGINVHNYHDGYAYGVWITGNQLGALASYSGIAISDVNMRGSGHRTNYGVFFENLVATTTWSDFTISGLNVLEGSGAGFLFYSNGVGTDVMTRGSIVNCTIEAPNTSYVIIATGTYTAGNRVIVSGVAYTALTGLFNPAGVQPFYELANSNLSV